jgi:ABC-type transport system involved in multi-copper enzyme maturation permease subunit
MNQVGILYHLARADFLERVRRYSFLVMLLLAAFLGYQVAIGNITVRLDEYRGEFNSAWVGSMMSLMTTFFVGWFGFYLVKGSVARDRETGVGQIMATTPLTRPLYTLGKWISNFSVLLAMVMVLALASIPVQLLAGENGQIDLIALLEPFVFIALPLLALVAALAVLFETIPFLQGGFGNLAYFIIFIVSLPVSMSLSASHPAYEPLGMGLLIKSMGEAARAEFPAYTSGFTLGDPGTITGIFNWMGVDWTADILVARFTLFGSAILVALIAATFFDRFDPSRTKPRRMTVQRNASISAPQPVSVSQSLSTVRLTPLTLSLLGNSATNQFRFFHVLLAELKLLLKGQRWWWYAIAVGFIIACFFGDPTTTRQILLPITWVWPVLIWSAMGNREIHNNVHQLTFSSASPVWRQLPAQWLAGFIVTLLTACGALARLGMDGDSTTLVAVLSGAIFIPSLALASGVWSGTSKLFEILYMAIWYIGPLNHAIPELDFIGTSSNGYPGFFIPLSIALILAAFIGRARQLQN